MSHHAPRESRHSTHWPPLAETEPDEPWVWSALTWFTMAVLLVVLALVAFT